MLLDDQIVALENALVAAHVPHAFGGAQALGYYGSIRATHNIDVNVFVPVDEAERVLTVLGALGADVGAAALRVQIERDGQTRVRWSGTPVELFFSYDPLHDSSMRRRCKVDFYGDAIHILSAEDLILYKATFNREKDWHDIASIAFAGSEPLDEAYIRTYLERIDSKEGARLRRVETVLRSGGESLGDTSP